ncbi:YdcH family protein [Vibrio mexicanus]|uniref:YdcH family protein n=1 Tax=Vibrio mexicanus TaxID=1004326 RepID=UPI00063C3E9C|nr:DUF465 domain-containing protein [Vibrio mexicanus]
MLGEVHSFYKDFPKYHDVIDRLKQEDADFLEQINHYDALDKDIRKLELRDSPIADDEMHQLKHQRSVLKDALYQRIIA